MIFLYKVSELLHNIKLTLAENFPLIDVVGEVFEVSVNKKSGHIYFSLKEEKYALLCACWKSKAETYQKFIVEGKNVKIRGRILTFPSNGKVYVDVQNITTYETGIIAKSLAELTKRLEQEGLFATKHKKLLPQFPKSIGLITSKDGAVIGDILTTLQQTFPCNVQLYDVNVQGTESVGHIIKALVYFQKLPKEQQPSFIIIARGGGALDDLFHFNDELLIRAMFACSIPIISAIGHESNSTLADLVADKAVVTPTAAVLFLPKVADLLAHLQKLQQQQDYVWLHSYNLWNHNVNFLHKYLQHPQIILNNWLNKIKDCKDNLQNMFTNSISRYEFKIKVIQTKLQEPILIKYKSNKLMQLKESLQIMDSKILNLQNNVATLARVLNSLSVQNTLKRGFSIVSKNGVLIKSAQQLKNTTYNLEFLESSIDVHITIPNNKPTNNA